MSRNREEYRKEFVSIDRPWRAKSGRDRAGSARDRAIDFNILGKLVPLFLVTKRKKVMTFNLQALHQRALSTITVLQPLCLMLSACGGGGGGMSEVASIPPPPQAPTPAVTLDVKTSWLDSIGTQAGTYDLLGRLTQTASNGDLTSRVLAPGEATMTIARLNDIFNYTLSDPGILPAQGNSFPSPEISWSANNDPVYPQLFEDDQNGKFHQYLGQRLTAYRVHNDGSEEEYMSYDFRRGSSDNGVSAFTYDIGYSYVSMGEWSSAGVEPGAQAHPAVDLLFVNGDRTAQSGFPVSGTATYDAHTLKLLSAYYGTPGLPFTLTADFGQRTISTQIDQNFSHMTAMGDEANIPGIHVGGSAPFSNDGTFNISLSGTVNYNATNTPMTPPAEDVTGTMNGALFGPHAEEVGGTFSLDRAGANPPIQDAFVGQQHHP
jgi:hypothetical protein